MGPRLRFISSPTGGTTCALADNPQSTGAGARASMSPLTISRSAQAPKRARPLDTMLLRAFTTTAVLPTAVSSLSGSPFVGYDCPWRAPIALTSRPTRPRTSLSGMTTSTIHSREMTALVLNCIVGSRVSPRLAESHILTIEATRCQIVG